MNIIKFNYAIIFKKSNNFEIIIKDGYKFDCRLYVLIKNINPLKIFLYKDGLARFATEPYVYPKVIRYNIEIKFR
ncbi:MAG: hypothetical protein ACK56F_28000 [bacterium]